MRNSIAAALLLLASAPAQAHVMLAQPSALPGSSYRAHFTVGHGCSGAPTTGLRVTIPAAVTDAAPVAKPGWTQNISGHTVTWSGGKLAADHPDSFDIQMTLPRTAQTLSFAAIQTCEKSTVSWSDAPGGAHPAPVLSVTTHPSMPSMPGMPGMPGMKNMPPM